MTGAPLCNLFGLHLPTSRQRRLCLRSKQRTLPLIPPYATGKRSHATSSLGVPNDSSNVFFTDLCASVNQIFRRFSELELGLRTCVATQIQRNANPHATDTLKTQARHHLASKYGQVARNIICTVSAKTSNSAIHITQLAWAYFPNCEGVTLIVNSLSPGLIVTTNEPFRSNPPTSCQTLNSCFPAGRSLISNVPSSPLSATNG